jgi:CheY-like chemotaxis protein
MVELRPFLLVDDSSEDIELTRIVLQEDCLVKNPIEAVFDGEEALDYLYRRGTFKNRTSQNPAVILLDLKMPKVSGFEVLETIKNDENLSSIPIVVLTSSKEDRDIVKSYEIGANAFVEKPVDSTRFMDFIKQLGRFWGKINVVPT